MRVGQHKILLPFQKGILLSNVSLVNLFKYLKSMYQVDYIITYHLNQDILENLFSYIRGMGGSNDHPTPLDIKYRLRWCILDKHSASVFTVNRNTEEDIDEKGLIKPMQTETDTCFSQTALVNVANHFPDIVDSPDEEKLVSSLFVEPHYETVEMDTSCFEMTQQHNDLLDE